MGDEEVARVDQGKGRRATLSLGVWFGCSKRYCQSFLSVRKKIRQVCLNSPIARSRHPSKFEFIDFPSMPQQQQQQPYPREYFRAKTFPT